MNLLILAALSLSPAMVFAGTIPTVAPLPGTTLGTTVAHQSGYRDFTWTFKCGGGNCQIGRFIGGEYWIAPKKADEQIILYSASPAGEANGMEIDPTDNTKQGFLSCQAGTYDPARNVMNALPAVLHPNSSVVKAYRSVPAADGSTICKFASSGGCCVESSDALTVLATPPPDGGASYFRPGFAGHNKALYSLKDFDFTRVPLNAVISAVRSTVRLSSYDAIHKRWHTPYVDHYMVSFNQYGRAFAPRAVLSDYGAEQNATYLSDVFAAMSSDAPQLKLPALTGLIQRGIDLYASWKNGITWPGGAGQDMGRKPPIVFFAALLNDATVKNDVMGMSTLHSADTQEDSQIVMGKSGVPIWGTAIKNNYVGTYWSQLFSSHYYDGSPQPSNSAGDNSRTLADPYGWIDGPAGKPGTFYMACCSTGGFVAYSVAQNLMPELCRVSNDPELNMYVKRVLTTGIHTQPDPCAPPDPREVATCAPYRAFPGCLYYGKRALCQKV